VRRLGRRRAGDLAAFVAKALSAVAGYSQNPLANKLGLKDGLAGLLIGVPGYLTDISGFPGFASLETSAKKGSRDRDHIHWFSVSRRELESGLALVSSRLKPGGTLWISWPKKASKVETDITEDVLRGIFLPAMLVDVKVCAVDDVWSGLKFMWRKEHRANVI
jgi:hypothetical protein